MDDKVNVLIFAEQAQLLLLTAGLSTSDSLEIVGGTYNVSDAKRIIDSNKNIVAIVDNSNGFIAPISEVLKLLSNMGLYSICICNDAKEGFGMLKDGATEMYIRSASTVDEDQAFFFPRLINRIKILKKKHQQESSRILKYNSTDTYRKIIAIGSSTGGTETIFKLLQEMPMDVPPIVIVQHMPPVFTKMYAERMNLGCKISVWEAKDGDQLKPGLALIAPGDYHMTVVKRNDGYFVECKPGPKVHGQCPSVDVLFNSIANTAGKDSVGVILTGMGADGAAGLLSMRKAGAYTIGQDEHTSIVYGMPKAAYDMGAVVKQLPVEKITADILENI